MPPPINYRQFEVINHLFSHKRLCQLHVLNMVYRLFEFALLLKVTTHSNENPKRIYVNVVFMSAPRMTNRKDMAFHSFYEIIAATLWSHLIIAVYIAWQMNPVCLFVTDLFHLTLRIINMSCPGFHFKRLFYEQTSSGSHHDSSISPLSPFLYMSLFSFRSTKSILCPFFWRTTIPHRRALITDNLTIEGKWGP